MLTYESHIVRMLNHGKQKVIQLYHCCYLFSSQDLCMMYKSWIRPTLEHSNALYFEAILSHLQCLNNLQTRIECTCRSTSQSPLYCSNAAIIGLVCHIPAGRDEGIYNYCPMLHGAID